MWNYIRIWIERNAVDISNGLLVIALYYFLLLGITTRVYIEYPQLFEGWIELKMIKIIALLQVGVWLIAISLVFNYLYEFIFWLERRK